MLPTALASAYCLHSKVLARGHREEAGCTTPMPSLRDGPADQVKRDSQLPTTYLSIAFRFPTRVAPAWVDV